MIPLLLIFLTVNTLRGVATDAELRIVGGHPVAITERPFQVLIYRLTQLGFVPDCGGSIISNRWILTAAHCIQGVPLNAMMISAGLDNLDNDKYRQWYDIQAAIPHERFQDSSGLTSNDIAMLRTKKEIKFSPYIQPIKIRMKAPVPSTKAVVSGFGVIAEGDTVMSSILREVTVTVMERTECVQLLEELADMLKLSDTHFCAAYLVGGRDACQGDSGGPLTINNILAGIVSWGIGCAERMVPAFYTDVSLYIQWIENNIKKYSNPYTKRCLPNIANKPNN